MNVYELTKMVARNHGFLWALSALSTREEIIEWLCANDRNGVYKDEDCKAEGFDPMTRDEALWQVEAALEEYE
jgi:hypothetical protein